jgi:hypothetical protein
MPPSRSITLLSPDELRVALVALLSDALLHYAISKSESGTSKVA